MEFEEPRRARGRGRGRGRPRGRPRGPQRSLRSSKRNKISSDEEEEMEVCPPVPEKPIIEPSPEIPQKFDQDCDISALEAPTFTTLDRGPSGPMLLLSWDHPVTLIGEKVLSPRIHTCDTCNKPILIYGRMIPCKHVFCLTCAKKEDRVCSRCGERVARVEQTGLGTVFMCTFKINDADCKRTYLSARDLQAHINHRHKKCGAPQGKEEPKDERLSHRDPRAGDARPDPRVAKEPFDHRGPFPPSQFPRPNFPGNPSIGGQPVGTHHIPVMTSARSNNLITVPIQDNGEHPNYNAQTGSQIHPQGPSNQPPRPPLPSSHPPSHLPPHMSMTGPPFTSPPPFPSTPPQYSYPPNNLPPTGVPPPPPNYPSAPPQMQASFPDRPPSSFPDRPPHYDNMYPPNQWSTPPPQGPPVRPPPPPHHHSHPPGPPTSYFR